MKENIQIIERGLYPATVELMERNGVISAVQANGVDIITFDKNGEIRMAMINKEGNIQLLPKNTELETASTK